MHRRVSRLLALALAAATIGLGTAGHAVAATPVPKCPSGTVATDGLCVAKGTAAQDVAQVVQSGFTDDALGAAVVGVWQGDKPLVIGAVGESMTGVPATVDMHHIAGNITNAMLSTVLLQQVEQGKLSLDDKLSKYFPDLPSADEITIEMLENSTSGYQHYAVLDSFATAYYANPFKHWTPDELVAYGVAGGPAFTPGTQFKFSDTNFVIVAQVLEQATGKPMATLMRKGVLEPLGMKNTALPDTAATAEPVLHAHTAERGMWEDSTFWDPSWTWYAGGIKSNQADLFTFLKALGTGKLLSKASHEQQLARPAAQPNPDRYFALGVPVVDGWIFTNPNLEGYSGALGYLPEKKLAVVVYTTRTQQTDPDTAPATKILAGITGVISPDQAIPVNPAG
jgi:CubicO group peptidase (beta-lactamase class C family)